MPTCIDSNSLYVSNSLIKSKSSNKDGSGCAVTETKDFMSSLAENDDIELYNKDVKKRLLDNYGGKFCPNNRFVEKRDSQAGFSRKLISR